MTYVTKGFHHTTHVSSNAARTLAFYRDLLGFDLVKKTVNFDMPDTYHLYFGKEGGAPGTIITYFEWPHAPKGNWGAGGVHHIALGTKDRDTLLQWKRWLTANGVEITGPYNRGYFHSIYFRDPDGQVLEIATDGPGFDIDEPMDQLGQRMITPDIARLPQGRDEAEIAAQTWHEPVDVITPEMNLWGLHHVTGHTSDLTAAGEFYEQALGLKLVKKTVNQDVPDLLHYFWANYDGKQILPGSDMTLFGVNHLAKKAREGVGQTHHVAFRADDDEQLAGWREHLLGQGVSVSEIRDRTYFKSIYFNAPDGLLIEIATDLPGFAVDEPAESLGTDLKLPEWLESKRAEIEPRLAELG
jgi:glyoxalase family protein